MIVEEYAHIFYKAVYEIENEVGPKIGQKMDLIFIFQAISGPELEEDKNEKAGIKNNTCHINDEIEIERYLQASFLVLRVIPEFGSIFLVIISVRISFRHI